MRVLEEHQRCLPGGCADASNSTEIVGKDQLWITIDRNGVTFRRRRMASIATLRDVCHVPVELSVLEDAVVGLGFAAEEPGLSKEGRRWRREARSGWLRLWVLVILIFNLLVGEHDGNLLVHAHVLVGYALAAALALTLALTRRGPNWSGTTFVIADAAVVIALFHEHLFGVSGGLDHSLTTPSLAIAFLLLTHVSLRLTPRLVLIFAVLVVTGWLSLLAFTAFRHGPTQSPDAHAPPLFLSEAALVAAFVFAAFVAFLLTRDHNILLKQASKSERRRHNLSRFFSPDVVAQLQAASHSLELERRQVAVMFVDLRSFTRFAECAEPRDLAELLADYRQHVTQAVFDHGGTVDKFIGDGVMSVFGQPQPNPDDADRALQCALQLNEMLARWKQRRQTQCRPALDAGIGLHFGPVIGGVLESGYHDEFTVFGDAVNVAERLERLSKTLGASLVVSAALLERVRPSEVAAPWLWRDGVELDGRTGALKVAYLPRTVDHLITNTPVS